MNHDAIYKSYLQMSSEKVAEQFGISSQTVRNIVKKIDPNAIRKPGRKPQSKYVETIRPQDWEELDSRTADTPVAVTPAE